MGAKKGEEEEEEERREERKRRGRGREEEEERERRGLADEVRMVDDVKGKRGGEQKGKKAAGRLGRSCRFYHENSTLFQ